MGDGFVQLYRTKFKKEYKIAFIFTFFVAMLVHIYKFTNTLPNHDSFYNVYSEQNVLGSGRWALSLACGLSSYFDLPWVNGFLSCLYIALTVVVIVALFKIKNPVLIGLVGALLAVSPSTTETLFFLFTADGYMLAMLLAAISVYFSRMGEKRITRTVLSGVCLCVSCGIYQAYISFALLLAVCYFIDVLLQNSHSKQECLKWVLRQVIIYVVSLAIYYIVWKLCMHFTATSANDYQGISDVGKVSIGLIAGGLFRSIKTTMSYFLQWDVVAHGFTLYNALNIVFLLVMAVGLFIALVKSSILKRKWAAILLVLCLIVIIPFACIWNLVSDSVAYRPMMLQSLSVLFILTALLYERWTRSVAKNAVCLLLIVITVNNALMANISYFYMNLCYERTYGEGIEMMMEIHDFQDEYEFDEVAIIGDRLTDIQWWNSDSQTGIEAAAGKIYILSGLLEKSVCINGDLTLSFLNTTFGMNLKSATRTRISELSQSAQVQSMDCWPCDGSMAVIDDTLVIKISE